MVPFEMTLERFGRWSFATRRPLPSAPLVAVLDWTITDRKLGGWGSDEPRRGPSVKGLPLESVSIRRTAARD